MANQSTILELRKYQELIALQAKTSNTIAYLPTGTGKTLIACELIRDRLRFVRIAREKGEQEKTLIVFIAPTKALVGQQVQYLTTHCHPVQAKEFNGDSMLDGKLID